jgi:hypothetical protein
MYNLLVSASDVAWKEQTGNLVYDRNRVGTYTTNVLQTSLKNNIGLLVESPSVFSQEISNGAPVKLGWIRKVEERQSSVRVYYEIAKDLPILTLEQLRALEWELDIAKLELYNTHVAVKDVDLADVLVTGGILTQAQANALSNNKSEKGGPRIHISPVVFRIPDQNPDPKLACVMMPFAKEYNPVHEALKAACEDAGVRLERVDSIWTEDVIIDEIFSLLYRSTYVICDFSGQSSNVFYEAGIAHTLGRTVIPIVQKPEHIPFDLRHRKYQHYTNDKEGLAELRTTVAGRLKTLIKNAK